MPIDGVPSDSTSEQRKFGTARPAKEQGFWNPCIACSETVSKLSSEVRMEQIKFVTGILLTSANPKRLADFYRDILNLPLEETTHGGTRTHYECDLGDVHFAIHPIYDGQPKPVNSAVKIGFAVFDLAKAQEHLLTKGISLYGPMNADFGSVLGLVDPDGNGINIYGHTRAHYEHLASRRPEFDLISEWKRSVE